MSSIYLVVILIIGEQNILFIPSISSFEVGEYQWTAKQFEVGEYQLDSEVICTNSATHEVFWKWRIGYSNY